MSALRPPSAANAPHSALVALPSELIQHVLSYVSPSDLCRVSQTCRHLLANATQDQLWQAILQGELGTPVANPAPYSSFRELYIAHFPYWFIPRQKLWFSDHTAGGRLIIARYDARRGCIEAYAVAAERKPSPYGVLPWDGRVVVYHTFEPKVQLDLNQTILSLNLSRQGGEPSGSDTRSMQDKLLSEIPMDIHRATSDRIFSTLFLARALSPEALQPNTAFWPPLILPSPNNTRARNQSPSGFRDPGQKPSKLSELCEAFFRIRQWMDFTYVNHSFGGISPSRMAESVSTYATLPEECYTPTKAKPYQGIWVGDYSGHGCEFLLITQPDNPLPLPDIAEQVFTRWPMYTGAPQHVQDQNANENDPTHAIDESSSEDSFHSVNEHAPAVDRYSGRLEAIKLTGDINVPRGEYTFIADDLGPEGLIGHTREPVFRDDSSPVDIPSEGTRIVKCAGHIAARGFIDDVYIPTQLILIGPNKLAHYWQPFGHVSFYERVDLDALLKI